MPIAAPSTKERIIEAAEELMLAKSFHSVGLTEILTTVKVPKGSFYHYFPSKEQFGVELIRHYVSEHTRRLEKFLGDDQLPALQRFKEFWHLQIGKMREQECHSGACLVAKLGSEVATFSCAMRQALGEGLRTWRNLYERTLRAGQKDGSIRRDLDPTLTATVLQDLWQGAIQRTQVDQSVEALRTAARFLESYLTAAPR